MLDEKVNGVLPFVEVDFLPDRVEVLERIANLVQRQGLTPAISDLQREVSDPSLQCAQPSDQATRSPAEFSIALKMHRSLVTSH